MYRIFVINPGSTSTKVALFEDAANVWEKKIFHDSGELAGFGSVNDQLDYRYDIICRTLELVILRWFAENWETIGGKIPGATENDRKRVEGIIADIESGKAGLKIRETGTVYFDWQKKQPANNMIRSAGAKRIRERQKAAVRLADLYVKEDLEPMIRIRHRDSYLIWVLWKIWMENRVIIILPLIMLSLQ